MRRRRVPEKIIEVSKELNSSVLLLQDEKMNLLDNINKIRNYYQGNDSEEIIEKFLNYLNYLDESINNYDYWSRYFSEICDYDLDNINSSLESLETAYLEENTLYDKTITLGDEDIE